MNSSVFENLVSKTKLGKRSIEAARLVLVDGMRQIEASQETGVTASQLSRVVSLLEKNAQIMNQTSSIQLSPENELSLSRAQAVKWARDNLGESIDVKHAPEQGTFSGEVLKKFDHHLVQNLGRNHVMIHLSSNINILPQEGKSVDFIYRNGLAETRDRGIQKERGGR